MMEGCRGRGRRIGGCRGGPFIPALGPGERLPSIGLWGVVLCRVDWTRLGWFPSHWARLGATLGGAVGEPAWDTVPLGTPLLMPVGEFWCSWCFSLSVSGSFLAGGDDWGGLSFPYWVFLPPA